MKTIALLVLVLAAACSKKDGEGAGSCRPLSVTVDGLPLPAMPHGLAKANNMNGDVSYEVDVFDHAKTTCDELLDKTGRQVPDGEISVRAFAGGAGMTGKGVAIGAHTQMGGNVTLVSAKPAAPGDIVKVCVQDVAFKPVAGAYKDKQVVVNGLFEGKFCGEQTW
ncbi:MAG TPA: hypothetical protein VIV40_00365 [Kofleriaceae bacterium]